MSPSDLFLAAMMLSAPAGTPEQLPTPDRWQTIQVALQQTAKDWEILDSRETRYILAHREDFQEDLDFLRKRRADLADAPHLATAALLPSRQVMDDYIHFNRAYRKHLELRLAWEGDRVDLISEAVRETERLYRLWDAMREAKCEYHYVTLRRVALKKLKETLGDEALVAGSLPPYVPDWSFADGR